MAVKKKSSIAISVATDAGELLKSNPILPQETEIKAMDVAQLVKYLLCRQEDHSWELSFVKGCVSVIPVLGVGEMRNPDT